MIVALEEEEEEEDPEEEECLELQRGIASLGSTVQKRCRHRKKYLPK